MATSNQSNDYQRINADLTPNEDGSYTLTPRVELTPFLSKKRVSDLIVDGEYPLQDELRRYITFGTGSSYIKFNSSIIRNNALNVLKELDSESFICVEAFQAFILLIGDEYTPRDVKLYAALAVIFCDVSGGTSRKTYWAERPTYDSVRKNWNDVKLPVTTVTPKGSQEMSFMIINNSPLMCIVKDWNEVVGLKYLGLAFDIRSSGGMLFAVQTNSERRPGLSSVGYVCAKLVNDSLANVIHNFSRETPSVFVSMIKRIPRMGNVDEREKMPACLIEALKVYKEAFFTKQAEGREYPDTHFCLTADMLEKLRTADLTVQFSYLMSLTESNDQAPTLFAELNERVSIDYDAKKRDEYFETEDKAALAQKRREQTQARRLKQGEKTKITPKQQSTRTTGISIKIASR
jgi:hypothetical protein